MDEKDTKEVLREVILRLLSNAYWNGFSHGLIVGGCAVLGGVAAFSLGAGRLKA
jgi:hypothetical protein